MARIIVGPMSPVDALEALGHAGVSHVQRRHLADVMRVRTDLVLSIDLSYHRISAQRVVLDLKGRPSIMPMEFHW